MSDVPTMTPITDDELVKEKSLREIYFVARSIPVSKFNQVVTVLVAVMLALYVCLTQEPTQEIAEKVRVFADYTFGFSVSILSFLLAGFTIYITVMKPDLLLFMASVRETRSGLPWIKATSFNFLRVMANYVVVCVFCLVVKLFGSVSGPVSVLFALTLTDPSRPKEWVAKIALVLLGAAAVHLFLLLQSFIFNIHSTAMATICWERQNALKKDKQP